MVIKKDKKKELVRKVLNKVEDRYNQYFADAHADWADESEAVVNEVIENNSDIDEEDVSVYEKNCLVDIAFDFAHFFKLTS